MWRIVSWWGYWVVAFSVLVTLTWKLLTSGDVFLIAVGVVYTAGLFAVVCMLVVAVAAWKVWPEIQHAAESARKPPPHVEPPGAKLEDAPPPERIH